LAQEFRCPPRFRPGSLAWRRRAVAFAAAMVDTENYGFIVEWHDQQADLLREYSLTVYVPPKGDLEASMYDPKTKRSFLKRMPIPGLRLQDLHQGSIVTIHCRQLKVKDYADARTQSALEASFGSFVLLTAPDAFHALGHILSSVAANGLRIGRLRLVSRGGPVVAMEVIGSGAEDRWLDMGDSLGNMVNRVSVEEGRPYFEEKSSTAVFDNCTLCVIRPHAVKSGYAGPIITAIMEAGFEISAAKMIHLDRAEAHEMLEVYKGVLPYHVDMVEGMTSAPSLALEVRGADGIVERFRELCGPHDVDMAKHLRPNSLRARFGLDNAQNGVHCTDLDIDAESEVRYLFQVLAK